MESIILKMKKERYLESKEFQNIKEIIYNSAKEFANNVAFVIKHKKDKEVTYENITYKKLLEDINAFGTKLYELGFTRVTVSRIFNNNPSSLEAIEKGISYRELGIDFKKLKLTKYKDLPNIKLPLDVRDYFRDNTVLNTLIAQGKVSV